MTENKAETISEDAKGDDAAPPAATENEQDKVKPVVFIGLFITALLGLGKFACLIGTSKLSWKRFRDINVNKSDYKS